MHRLATSIGADLLFYKAKEPHWIIVGDVRG
jgi:hypothetical protein